MMAERRELTLGEMMQPKAALQNLCDVLNAEQPRNPATGKREPTERGKELFALIARWQKAPNLATMQHDDPGIFADLHHEVQPWFQASKTGKGGAYRVTPNPPKDRMPHTFVVWMFAHLLTNPLCEKLAGPCARCGNYFVKKRASQKVYCSRKCGNAATALIRTREKLDEKHKDKIEQAKAAMRKWRTARTDDGWKAFVSDQTGIDKRFLTRAANKGELKPPKKG